MPADLPSHDQPRKNEIAVEVSELRAPLRSLPLAKLSRLCGEAPSALCEWERGRRVYLRPTVERRARQAVRQEFARFVRQITQLAERHGIST